MRVWPTLVRRELAGYFVSWTGYVILAVVMFWFGLSFAILIHGLNAGDTDRPITELFCDNTLFMWLILLLAPPLITISTMRLRSMA